MSTSDGPVVTYQIQYLVDGLWEDIPHKAIYDVEALEDVILRIKDKFPSTTIRILKVTRKVFELKEWALSQGDRLGGISPEKLSIWKGETWEPLNVDKIE